MQVQVQRSARIAYLRSSRNRSQCAAATCDRTWRSMVRSASARSSSTPSDHCPRPLCVPLLPSPATPLRLKTRATTKRRRNLGSHRSFCTRSSCRSQHSHADLDPSAPSMLLTRRPTGRKITSLSPTADALSVSEFLSPRDCSACWCTACSALLCSSIISSLAATSDNAALRRASICVETIR